MQDGIHHPAFLFMHNYALKMDIYALVKLHKKQTLFLAGRAWPRAPVFLSIGTFHNFYAEKFVQSVN